MLPLPTRPEGAAGDGGQAISEAELRIERLLDEGGKEWDSKPLRSPTGDFRVDLPGAGSRTRRLLVPDQEQALVTLEHFPANTSCGSG